MAATADLMVKQTDPKDDYIVLKALVFPYINVLWLGVVIMVIGFLISIIKLLTTGSKAIEE
jgi:cytochrome c-type biogenesis protein CcmF